MSRLSNPRQEVPVLVFHHDVATRACHTVTRRELAGDHEIWGDAGLISFEIGDQLAQPIRTVLETSEGDIAPVAQPTAWEHRAVAVVKYYTAVTPAAGVAGVGLLATKRGLLSRKQQSWAPSVLYERIRAHRLFARHFRGMVILFSGHTNFFEIGRSINAVLLHNLISVRRVPSLSSFVQPRLICLTIGSHILALICAGLFRVFVCHRPFGVYNA